MMRPFAIVVAFDSQYGIGKKGGLAWNLPSDLKHFKEVTSTVQNPSKKNAVIMGRKTWDSLPPKFRPLPGRVNIVLTREIDSRFRGNDTVRSGNGINENVLVASSLDEALNLAGKDIENVFVIGGAQIYALAIEHPLCQKLCITHVKGDFGCDAFFPAVSKQFFPISASEELEENGISFQFSDYLKY